jgi:hypothetical protein
MTALPAETKPAEESAPEKSYIQDLSTHTVRVHCGTALEELSEENFIIKLDNEPIAGIAKGNYLVCEIGSYAKDGSLLDEDFPGMNPSVNTNTNTVTNYITTIGDSSIASSSVFIKYTYFVDGVDMATAKVELVRHEGSTTYYMTPDITTLKLDTNGKLTPTIISAKAFKLTTGDTNTTDFNGY